MLEFVRSFLTNSFLIERLKGWNPATSHQSFSSRRQVLVWFDNLSISSKGVSKRRFYPGYARLCLAALALGVSALRTVRPAAKMPRRTIPGEFFALRVLREAKKEDGGVLHIINRFMMIIITLNLQGKNGG
jgi:hypothetical protein